MKAGDFVRGDELHWTGDIPYGIVVGPSPRTNTWGDIEHRWWLILLLGGFICEDTETVWEVVDENRDLA